MKYTIVKMENNIEYYDHSIKKLVSHNALDISKYIIIIEILHKICLGCMSADIGIFVKARRLHHHINIINCGQSVKKIKSTIL